MDVLSVATTVLSLCKAITTWIDELRQREAVIVEIASTVSQIQSILAPFTLDTFMFEGEGEIQLSQSIRNVGDVLERIREHLIVWNVKPYQKILSFVKPSILIQRLRDDEMQLIRQLLMLLSSFAVVGYFRGRDSSPSQMITSHYSSSRNLSDTLGSLTDARAIKFWRDFVGAKINFVPADPFVARLNRWRGGGLNKSASGPMIMCLDEFNIGGVTPDNMARALGDETLDQFVERYIRGTPKLPLNAGNISNLSKKLKTPLLIWVDDDPKNNAFKVDFAQRMGINVIQLTSTAIAKAWIAENAVFLHKNDNGSQIRFITDNTQMEYVDTNDAFLNNTAGRSLLQYLRGHLYKAPVLVSTRSTGIENCRYVELYDSAGATANIQSCLRYIHELGNGRNDDKWWQGYNR